jgi:rhodanese-related sulfurtransferase
MSFLSRLIGTQLPIIDVTSAHERPTGVLLVDVREPNEWAEGHAPGALHRPLGGLDPRKLPKADRYFVICRSGNRSARATEALVAAGLDAYNVEGGMTAWMRAGLPVVQD